MEPNNENDNSKNENGDVPKPGVDNIPSTKPEESPPAPAPAPEEATPTESPKPMESTPEPAADPEPMAEPTPEVSSSNGEVESLKAEVEDLKNQLNSAKNEVAGLKSELDQLKGASSSSEGELQALKAEVDKLKSDNETLLADKNTAEANAAEMSQKINSMEGEKSGGMGAQELQEELKVLRIIASTGSQALDMYEVLKAHRSLNLRKLSMQSGIAARAASEILEGLEAAGLVKFERAGPDDTDPKITLL